MFNIDKKKFGAFVAALRKEKGITQKELSEQLCISDKAVSKWETGVSLPDTKYLLVQSQFRLALLVEQQVFFDLPAVKIHLFYLLGC